MLYIKSTSYEYDNNEVIVEANKNPECSKHVDSTDRTNIAEEHRKDRIDKNLEFG